ncbi:mitotic spindle assembly checkpoint MAD2 [Fusarium subglutinans]|uniref:Mitotic spindle assembly checkpoint MAD2 n=1 Tax=Gibberella subglutinans TaxID=42677 RepID=A0A8H5QE69_GIBSU|nr:mitotic spindle assembly checkpoint MAD2 [Fusarium subglutinans]KAF5614231.1 mitotic spindle assembly checkpoint MAD2 [Fusarium subglutinans]
MNVRSEPLCSLEGCSDAYGVGIRAAFYAQWLGSLLMEYLSKENLADLRFISIFSSAAASISLVIGVAYNSLEPLDIYFLLLLAMGFFIFQIPLNIWRILTRCQAHLDPFQLSKESHGHFYHLMSLTVLSANVSVGTWYFKTFLPQLDRDCRDLVFLFGKVSLESQGYTTAGSVFFIGILVAIGGLIFLNACCTFTKSSSRHRRARSRNTWRLKVLRGISGFIVFTFLVLSIELPIKWNHIQGVNDFTTVAQLLPLMLTIGIFLRSWAVYASGAKVTSGGRRRRRPPSTSTSSSSTSTSTSTASSGNSSQVIGYYYMYPTDHNDEEDPQYDHDDYYDYYNDYNNNYNYNYSNTAEGDETQIQWPQGVHFSRCSQTQPVTTASRYPFIPIDTAVAPKMSSKETSKSKDKDKSKVHKLSLKGSARLVAEFFQYSIHSILFQRGVYPAEDFTVVKKYGLNMLVSADDQVKAYIKKIMSQLDKWMVGGKISKLVIVITDKDTGEHVERWQFDVQIFQPVKKSKSSKSSSKSQENAAPAGSAPTAPEKTETEIQAEIAAIFRQITASVTFLPQLSGDCTFNVLVYADADSEVPVEWGDSDAKEIENGEKVQLRGFSTANHRVDTLVSYRFTD